MNTKKGWPMNVPISVGDTVSTKRWEDCAGKSQRIGNPATVIKVERGHQCESGIMVTVVGMLGKRTIDLNWLNPIEKGIL